MNWVVVATVTLSLISFIIFPEHYARLSVDQDDEFDLEIDTDLNGFDNIGWPRPLGGATDDVINANK